MPRSCGGAIDEERVEARHAHVEGNRNQAAYAAGHNRDRQQPLPLVRHAPRQPRKKTRIEALNANPVFQFRESLVEKKSALQV